MNPHKILGIEKGATPDEIRKAYRKAAVKYHPDIGGDSWAFQQIQDAYDELMGNAKSKPRSKEKSADPNNKASSERQS